jgi:WD40 repeat protein
MILEHLLVNGFEKTVQTFERERLELNEEQVELAEEQESEQVKEKETKQSKINHNRENELVNSPKIHQSKLSSLHSRLNSLIKLQQKLILYKPKTSIFTSSFSLLGILKGHSSPVTTLDFHHALPILASASSGESKIKIWHEDGDEILTILAHADSVRNLEFHPTANAPYLLASCSVDGSVGCFRSDDAASEWSPLGFVCWHDECAKDVSWLRVSDGENLSNSLEGNSIIEGKEFKEKQPFYLLASLSTSGSFVVTEVNFSTICHSRQIFSLSQVECFASVGEWLVIVNGETGSNVDFYLRLEKNNSLDSPIAIERVKAIGKNAAVAWNKAGQLIILQYKSNWEIIQLPSFDWIIDCCCPVGQEERGFLVGTLGKEPLVLCHGSNWQQRQSFEGEPALNSRTTCLAAKNSLVARALADSSIAFLKNAKQ